MKQDFSSIVDHNQILSDTPDSVFHFKKQQDKDDTEYIFVNIVGSVNTTADTTQMVLESSSYEKTFLTFLSNLYSSPCTFSLPFVLYVSTF